MNSIEPGKSFFGKVFSSALLVAAQTIFLPKPVLAGDEDVTQVLEVKGYLDGGQVVRGSREDTKDNAKKVGVENYFLSNIGISLISRTTVQENLHLNIGVGGLYWYSFSNLRTNPESRRIQFGPGVTEASFKYDFTDNLFLKFGFFTYKYNSDARNLGEYLLRSQAYPGLVKTGGWSILNNAAYQSMGVQTRWTTFGGAWTHDFLLFSETEETPIFDMSPAYVSTLRIGNFLELGGGFSLHHWIPIKPSEEAPIEQKNTYVEISNMPVSLPEIDSLVSPVLRHRQHAVAAGTTLKGMEKIITKYRDAAGNQITAAKDATGESIYLLGADTLRASVRQPLTYQGIKLMGRASLDLKPLLGMEEILGPNDFKVYVEAAVLGIENQPFFYEKMRQRIPAMVGVNIPAFKFLDILSMEFEYYPNPWPDNRKNAFENSWPIWYIPDSIYPADFEDAAKANYSKDDWKWSILATRTLMRGLRLHVQAANDHLRLRDEFLQSSVLPLTNEKSHWYYLVRLEWGI
jgi:hypothetical protein